MTSQQLGIDEFTFQASNGEWSEFTGIHSGQDLTSIDLDLVVEGSDDVARVRELVQRPKVHVRDPIAGREYDATLQVKSESYRDGAEWHSFNLNVRELDVPPSFAQLEIEGVAYEVLEYKQTDMGDGAVSRHAVLRLDRGQLEEFRRAASLERNLSIRRVGVDDEPMSLRLGRCSWSVHESGEQEYYKQVVGLYPQDAKNNNWSRVFASGTTQTNLIGMAVEAHVKLRVLVKELTAKGVIESELAEKLLADKWRDLVDNDMLETLSWRLERVDDAVEDL